MTGRLPGLAALATVAVLASGACRPDEEAVSTPPPSPPAAGLGALSQLDPPAGAGAFAPRLAPGGGGPWLSWLEPDPAAKRRFRLLSSRLAGGNWSAPVEIAAGERWFANWADLPAVAEGRDGRLVAHWLERLGEETYAYGVRLAGSSDGGDRWQPMGWLHDDRSAVEHGFVSYAAAAAGIHAFWLDGRGMAEGGPMELRAALLTAGAAAASTVLDERVCECCATAAAVTAAGPIVAYRDRSDEEVRDVSIVRATAGGWSEPRRVHEDGWQIHGCPVNGPAVDARGQRVAVAWFTAAENRPRVQVAFSDDAGATFRPPVTVDGDRPLGRVDVAVDPEGRALVSWLGSVDEETSEIRVARVAPSGEIAESQVIAETTPKRSAGFPHMVLDGDRLVIAWTEDGEPSRVRAGVLPCPRREPALASDSQS